MNIVGPNIPVLEAVMTQIKDHPELHDQGSWFAETDCGTAMCFAGWACHLSGMKQLRMDCHFVHTPWGEMTARRAAQRVLGLTEEQQAVLFSGGNSRAMLELMVKDLANSGDLQGDEFHYLDREQQTGRGN
jgi:hypothetical protein